MAKLKDELVRRLAEIPGVTHRPWPDRDDGFSTVHFEGKEIGHFHSFNEIDLRLGKALIESEGLVHYADSAIHPKRSPNSQFVELRFRKRIDLDRVVRLVNLLVEKAQ